MTFDPRKIPHLHLPNGICIRLDTMKDIDSGKKYTQKEIDKIKEEARKK